MMAQGERASESPRARQGEKRHAPEKERKKDRKMKDEMKSRERFFLDGKGILAVEGTEDVRSSSQQKCGCC